MEQLDDEQVEQLMLESEGFDILEDAKTPIKTMKTPVKSPLKSPAAKALAST